MRVINIKKKENRNESQDPYYVNRIGAWGNVTEVNSRLNACSVVFDTGLTYPNIPVCSMEWVNSEGDYLTAERYLPPKGSRVFVLMPTHSIAGAFILCSGYAKGETDTHELYAQSDSDKESYNSIKERVTQGGWNEKEYYSNGNKVFVSNDEKITIEINPAEDSQNSLKKEIAITAWDNEIHIDEDGITITSNKDLTLQSSGNTTIETTGSGSTMTVNSKNGSLTINANGQNVSLNASQFSVNSTSLVVS